MEEQEKCKHPKKHIKQNMNNGGSAVYCFGLIGAAVYFIGHAATFWMGVVGFLKALVWPAFLAYYAFEFFIK
ncbi:hypothetical protein KKA15_01345 [Patescibacteria group bacterium]|nr:hypothetical protein [Patescibacteria group bacterium]